MLSLLRSEASPSHFRVGQKTELLYVFRSNSAEFAFISEVNWKMLSPENSQL